MNSILRLYNPETDETIDIFVSEAEAQRAETDLEFATQLLERHQSQGSLVSPSASTSSGMNSEEADDVTGNNFSEASSVNGFKWPHEAILLLIEEFRKEETNLVSGRISQKKVWSRIGEVLQDKGYIVTGPQCLSKFNGMKRTYKSIKDHNGKSGNHLRTWPYLDLMESLLGEKPFMQPVATLSSTATGSASAASSTPTIQTTPTTSTTPVNQEIASPNNSTRKRKATFGIADAILESRRLAEESRERRHRERMEEKREFQQKMLKLMGDLIDKI